MAPPLHDDVHRGGRPLRNDPLSLGVLMKTVMLLALLGLFCAVQMGCEGKADVDDDGASIKVD